MQQTDTPHAPAAADTTLTEAAAGVIGGVVAGVAYLVAQVSFTAMVHPGAAAEPLQRIAAILMGPDAAPPPAEFSFTVFGMALIIHFGLAMAFGRLIATVVWRRALPAGIAIGALAGLAFYALDFGLIAPTAFPWFTESIRSVTIADHVLFGGVVAAVCLTLRRRGA